MFWPDGSPRGPCLVLTVPTRREAEPAPPNPNPLRDYPHGYQPWLTPGLNWGY